MTLIARFAWTLPALVLIGAIASLFGPQDPWMGIDVGTTGTFVFGLALWGAGLSARYPDQVFPADWSLAERRAWTGLLFVGLIFLHLLRHLWTLSSHEPPGTIAEMAHLARHFMWNLLVLLIAWAAVAGAIGRDAKGEVDTDERDWRLQRAAHRAGDGVLTLIVVAAICMLVALPAKRLDWWLAPLITANVLIGVLICKSLAENVWLVASYVRSRH